MPHQLTPAQLELQAARRAAKEAKAALIAANPKAALTPEEVESRRFLKREWIENPSAGSSRGSNKAKIVTWNLLAQTLIRKDLFPGSDCLRWPERKPMFLAELEHYSDADILCFQECDRLEEFLPALPDHVNLHCKGPGKQHGLVIMYRQSKYEVKASFKVLLDEGELSSTPTPEGDDLATSRQRKGVSRKTNNVGLIAALKDIKTGEGIVVVTTHLFWHPIFVYERTRQVIVLLRAIAAFKAKHDCESWPTVVAGDFNIEPDVATYQLMTKPQAQLPKELETQITTSRVVHDSVDKFYRRKEGLPIPDPAPIDSQAGTGSNTPAQNSGEAVQPESVVEEEGEAEGGGQGSVSTSTPDDAQPQIKNTRPAEAADGIATYDELLDTIRTLLPNGLESSYRSYDSSPDQMGFGKRDGFKATFSTIPDGLAGHDEPAYTCYTSLFQLTLDYLFLYPDEKVKVTQLLRPARREELGSGLPSKAICPSDHLAMGCEISW